MIKTDLMSLFLFWRRFQTDESKIMAWESLQKAKAEAAIRKLEVFLFITTCIYIELSHMMCVPIRTQIGKQDITFTNGGSIPNQ